MYFICFKPRSKSKLTTSKMFLKVISWNNVLWVAFCVSIIFGEHIILLSIVTFLNLNAILPSPCPVDDFTPKFGFLIPKQYQSDFIWRVFEQNSVELCEFPKLSVLLASTKGLQAFQSSREGGQVLCLCDKDKARENQNYLNWFDSFSIYIKLLACCYLCFYQFKCINSKAHFKLNV